MENALLIALALLPLGFVVLGAAAIIKNRLNKKPELRLVPTPTTPAPKSKPKKKKGTKNARKN